MISEITVNVDQKLALNKYNVDESFAHIELNKPDDCQIFDEEFDKLIIACPAALYKRDKNGAISFDYAGCLECGTCRILCGDTILKHWFNPGPTQGIEYRWG